MKTGLRADKSPNYYGIALRYLFRKAGRGSQKEVAERLNISTAHLQRIQTGLTNGSVTVRNAIAEALGTTHEDVIALGRELLEKGDDLPAPATMAGAGGRACLNSAAVAWWPDIVRYIEMVNMAALGDDPELYFDMVGALIREATKVLDAARARFKAEQGGLTDEGDSKRFDVEAASKDAAG